MDLRFWIFGPEREIVYRKVRDIGGFQAGNIPDL